MDALVKLTVDHFFGTASGPTIVQVGKSEEKILLIKKIAHIYIWTFVDTKKQVWQK